jgi:hypothetical protein
MTNDKQRTNMKTKATLAVVFLALVAGLTPSAHAAEPKTLVIIDSGFNTQLPFFAGKVIDEACFIEFGKCPNGQASMTGPGAATLAATDAAKDRTFSHGTQMASVAHAVNPSGKFVLIRVVGRSDKGFANTYTTKAVQLALDWVSANAARLNVGAVSISMGRAYKEAACPIETPLQSRIVELKASNIGVFTAAGNRSNQTKVDYPACIPEAITVGATDTRYVLRNITGWIYPIMPNSNGGADLDLYALGRYNTTMLDGSNTLVLGTSAATAAVASKWTQFLSEGGTYDSLWATIQSKLEKAYRSPTDVVQKQYNLI